MSPNLSAGEPESLPSKTRYRSLRKEAALGFLAVFYFLIATNTQTGWLFLMSSFMLGILVVSWTGPRRAIEGLSLQQTMLNSAQRGVPLRVRLELLNKGDSMARETHIEQPQQSWSGDQNFRWTVARLEPGRSISSEFSFTPIQRGEHTLSGARVICGAPFGLFSVYRENPPSAPFLVYPKLEMLPSRQQRSRLSGVLSELSSPHRRGDGRTLRSLRDYRSGDDLRMVHWKSSAKTGGTLLVREHQAPSRQLSLLVLDTSRTEPGLCFEKAVSLTASILWAAYRAGTRSCLVLRDSRGEWHFHKRWQEQFSALARVQPQTLSFEKWQAGAQQALSGNPVSRAGSPLLVTALTSPSPPKWPSWPGAIVACVSLNALPPASGAAIYIDSAADGFQEIRSQT